ncbi:MAG: efflux RND transporter periplasmic adaptor subunit [Sporomusaceae bacterium]|nr:efflux RND transporter periplasmic adaptor subunit [Sporomusaceae bacterium]
MLQKIRRYKLWLAAAVIAVAAFAAAKWGADFASETANPTAAVRIIAAARGDITAVVTAAGTLAPVKSAAISARTTGLVKEVLVQEHDVVKAGQTLLLLDSSRLDELAAEAEARLAAARSSWEQLSESGGTADERQLAAARMEYDIAQAAYTAAVERLADVVIRAPIDGTVLGPPVAAGQTVAADPARPLLTIADLSQLRIEAEFDAVDINKILVGQPVRFWVDAYPGQRFNGVIASVSHQPSRQSSVRYPVVIDVDAPAGLLKPAMAASVAVTVGERNDVLAVPPQAIKQSQGQQYVQILKNGQPQNAAVVTGLAASDAVEIVKGIKEGDQILLPQLRPQGPRQ